MNVLVTGGAGFIGSHLVRALLRAGHHVRVIDDLSTGLLWRLDNLMSDIEWLEADVGDRTAAARAVAGVEVVFHQAAVPSVARSVVDPVGNNRANVDATVTLLQACREAGVRRLVFAASSSAYGDSLTLPKVETMSPSPLSPYAVSKLASEQYCRVFSHLGFLETVSLRYFNIFGPMQDPASEYAAVIPKFARAILLGEPVPINGDGSQSRDFTYVDNAVEANLAAMAAPGVSGETINVGCGERYDLNCLVSELGRITGKDPKVLNVPRRPGDVAHSLADIDKARRLLHYEPAVLFFEGLRRTVEWMRGEGAKQVGL
jgi:UDP-glucose 4-epimerase